MNIEFYRDNTKYFFNCRIKAIRDLLLLQGIEVPYEILFLLSLDNISRKYELDLYGISIPVFIPLSSNADVKIFENLEYHDYLKIESVNDDKEEIDKCLLNGQPVIVYFSKPHLYSEKLLGKIAHFPNSLLLYARSSKTTYQTNLERNMEVRWDLLEKARRAELLPESPKHKKLIVITPKSLYSFFEETQVSVKIKENLLRYCNQYLVNHEDTRNYVESVKNAVARLLTVENLLMVQRLFAVIVQCTVRFSALDKDNLSYGRAFLVKALRFYAKMLGDSELETYCATTKLGEKWSKVGTILLKEAATAKSRMEINNIINCYIEHFDDAVSEEVKFIKGLFVLLRNGLEET